MSYVHISVMLNEVLQHLDPKSGERFIDATLGGGGYTAEILKRVGDDGQVLAIDADEMALDNARDKFKKHKNIFLAHDNFRNLQQIVQEKFPADSQPRFDGIVFDFGLSSAQLADRTRGFSFQYLDAPLDMSFGASNGNSAAAIVNNFTETEIARIIYQYGEEKFSRRIAKNIVQQRAIQKIKTVGDLVNIIERSVPKKSRGHVHPATKTFQALRIAVNDELASIQEVLPAALSLLNPGGRIVTVSFHSLEDKIVKDFFRQEALGCVCPPDFPICNCGHQARLKIINKRGLAPTAAEIARNPRSRSAKLRAAIRI